MVCQGLLRLVFCEFIACPGKLPSCHKENYHDRKSGQDLDPDKPGLLRLIMVTSSIVH